MLTLFQNITPRLTPEEKKTLVPMLIDCLAFTHEGYLLKSYEITGWFAACEPSYKVSDVRIRKLINYIRITKTKQGLNCHWGKKIVIGTSKGYFLTVDRKIVIAQMESMQGRVDAETAVIRSLAEELQNI